MRRKNLVLLFASLYGIFSAVGQLAAQGPKPDACPPKSANGYVCIDANQPVTPLPIELEPNESLIIEVKNKTPWQAIQYDVTFTAVEGEMKKQLETLFKFLTKSLIAVPIPEKGTETAVAETSKREPEPFGALLTGLNTALAANEAALTDRRKEVEGLLHDAKDLIANPHADGFAENLKLNTMRLKEYLDKPPASLAATQATIDRTIAISEGPALLALPAADQERVGNAIELVVRRLVALRLVADELGEAEDGLSGALKLFQKVEKEGPTRWFHDVQTYSAPKNHKANVTISMLDRSDPGADKAKLATVSVTWKARSLLAMSLGFGISTVAKKNFSLDTIRGNGPLTDSNALTYKVGETVARPSILPLALVHIRVPSPFCRDWHLWATAGAGVDVGGDSPTGEFATGVSFHFGPIYISPMIHFGRRKELQSGYTVGESAPKDFAVPTKDVWAKGFVTAITYRLPF